ncbi:hypothetical protein ACHQM5_028366 [Ranunculus cassubicifolius]
MAYIPPHKRHSKDINTPQPTPSLFIPPSPSHHHRNSKQSFKPSINGGKILYCRDSIHRWFVIPSNDDHQDTQFHPCSVRLKEFPHEFLERRNGAKPFILVSDHPQQQEVNENAESFIKSPWLSIEEKIKHDLLTCFQNARNEMCKDVEELNVPRFVIRFGKILFHSGRFVNLDNVNKPSSVESLLSRMKTQYYTNVPDSFVRDVLSEFGPKSGFDFFGEKDCYEVKVFDKSRPESTISCKCSLNDTSGELDVYKVELDEVRQMVVDISCLDKNLDLRLLTASKRILNSLTDEEKHSLSSLVKSAVKDTEAKGGLRWPLGNESFGDRYTVVGVWHTRGKTLKSSSVWLKVREADRFDFTTSTGGVSKEISLRIPKVNKHLKDETLVELDPLVDMVSDTLKLVWNNFLCWEGSFV